jgi:sirohydrochlorin cobaltochelatase
MLDLPAAPHFQLMKEIKNVVTVIAKTSHYWLEHMPRTQQRGIATLFAQLAKESPLIEPGTTAVPHLTATIAAEIHRQLGLRCAPETYPGWLGVECPSVRAAIWMMRALVASNVLSRREGTTLFVPINPASDSTGNAVIDTLIHTHALACAKGMF